VWCLKIRHQPSHRFLVASLGTDKRVFQFKIILTTTFLIIAVTSLNRPVPHWKLVFGYFKKFLLQKKKFFAVLVEVDPLKKKG